MNGHLHRMLCIIFVLTALGMGAVWQRVEVTRLGYEVQDLDRARDRLKEENRRLLFEINALRSPERLMRLARDGGFDLAPPAAWVQLAPAEGGAGPAQDAPRPEDAASSGVRRSDPLSSERAPERRQP